MNVQPEPNHIPALHRGVIRRPTGVSRGVARVEYPSQAPAQGLPLWPAGALQPVAPPAPEPAPGPAPAPAPMPVPVPEAAPEPAPEPVSEPTPLDRPQWTGGWRRAVQAITAGLLRPGAADAMNEERALVARVRSRPRHPRVVAVVAGKGGVGTSTTAAATAMVLAALRHDSTALLDPRHGTGSLGVRLAGQPAPTIEQLATVPPAAPLRINGSLDVIDGAPWHSPVPAARLCGTLDALRDSHALTIVDVGNHPADNTRVVLGRADQVVVVAGATRDAVESARVAVSRIRSVAPALLSTVVVVVPSVTPGAGRGYPARVAAELGVPGSRAVPVPFDPALARGGAIALREVRPATRTAFLRLAGLIADPGAPSADPLAAEHLAAA